MDTLAVFMAWFLLTPRILAVAVAVAVAVVVAEAPGCERAVEVAGDLRLWVPRTSSSPRDQAIFVDQTTGASLPSDAVLLKIDRFG